MQYDSRSIANVQYEQNGAALAFAPLAHGTEYTVWGYTPQPQPAQLAKSLPEYPPEISVDGLFLRVGPHSASAPPFGTLSHRLWATAYFGPTGTGRAYAPLYAAAERIAGKATNPYAATVALEAWLRSSGGFVYDEQPPHGPGAPPLVQFVTKTKRGYCQHFAGAMALMLRYLGIPARVAAGFTSGSYDAKRGTWTVYDRDAHTWVEVWFKGYGWLPFDPTPSRGTLGGPYTTSSLTFDGRARSPCSGVPSTAAASSGSTSGASARRTPSETTGVRTRRQTAARVIRPSAATASARGRSFCSSLPQSPSSSSWRSSHCAAPGS